MSAQIRSFNTEISAFSAFCFALKESQSLKNCEPFLEECTQKIVLLEQKFQENTIEVALLNDSTFAEKKKLIALLITKGADINRANADGLIPLHQVILMMSLPSRTQEEIQECSNILKLLLDNGACVDQQDGQGWTPLVYAVFGQVPLECIKILCEKGAQLNLGPCDNAVPPLWIAEQQAFSLNQYAQKCNQALDNDNPHPVLSMVKQFILSKNEHAQERYDYLRAIALNKEKNVHAMAHGKSNISMRFR